MLRRAQLKRKARAWLVCALSGLAATPAMSQDTAVVFVHGIQSSSSVWSYPLLTIQSGLRVNPVRPDLDWTRYVSDQLTDLTTYLTNNSATSNPSLRMPFLARSAGGLVTRDYSRDQGRVRQLATIATPHQGAFLANQWLNYNVPAFAFYTMDALFAPIGFYENEDAENPEILTWAYNAMYPFWLFANGLDAALCPHLGMCLVWDGVNEVAAPIAYDLSEGSTVTDYEWGRLNNQANLDREAGGPNGIDNRVGFWVDASAQGVVFDLLGLYRPDWIDARDVTIGFYSMGYDHYRHPWDPWLAENRWLWVDGMIALIDMDSSWQWLAGTLLYYERYVNADWGEWGTYLVYAPNDGVVPAISAAYPGGTRNERIPGDLPHVKQADNVTVRQYLYDVLRLDFGIPIR